MRPRMFVRAIAFLTLLSLAGGSAAHAQDHYLRLYAQHTQARVYTDVAVLPTDSGAVALFAVRIPNSRLVFVREREPLAGAPFVARVEVTVQVRAADEIVTERTWQATHTAASYDASTSRTIDFEGRIPIHLAAGHFSYRLVLRDLTSDSYSPTLPRSLFVPDFEDGAVGPPIAERIDPDKRSRLALANLGGDLPFDGGGRLLVPVTVMADALAFRIWRLSQSEREKGAASSEARRSVDPDEGWEHVGRQAVDLDGASLVLEGTVPASDWQAVRITAQPLQPAPGADLPLEHVGSASFHLVPISLAEISERDGVYAIETRVVVDGENLQTISRFSFHWRDLPIALHDAETAIRMLSFIESPERIRSMLRGGRDAMRDAVTAYWSERDPTPGTPFNELMAEYYQRIDYAALTFRTGGGPAPNGLQTDQARIYIVYGPPDDVERTLPAPGGVEETWRYDDGRRFVFRAASSLDPLALQNE